jgi:dipeptidyl aminopeptidase/acylaminoacyl peptidase
LLLALSGSVLAAEVTEPSEIPLEAFAQLPVMHSAELSPNGSYMAYIRPLNGRGYLVIQNLVKEGDPVVAPPPEKMEFDWLHWGNDNRLVFTLSAMGKRGFVETTETRLWAIDADGKNAMSIVKPSTTSRTGSGLKRNLRLAQLQDNVIHWLPDEPHHILLSLDGDGDGAAEVRRIDIRDGDFDIVRNDSDGIQDWMTDQSGEVRFGWGYRNKTLRLMTKKADGKWHSGKKAQWWDEGFFPQGFTEFPDIMYMHGPDENGYEVVRTMNVETGEFLQTVFEQEGIDAGGLSYDPLTGRPVGVNFVEHQPQVEYFDEELAALQRGIDKALPETVNQIISMTSDRRKVLVKSSSDVDAGVFQFLNRDTKRLDFVSEAMPGLLPEMMGIVEPINYTARDGLDITGYLTIPRDSSRENLQVIVMPHGGPGARDAKTFWFLSQFLVSRGYAVFQPNFRGSSGFGRRFEAAGRKEWGGKMQQDVTDGAHWLVEQGIADPDRMCIVGWSYGGYSAAMGAVQTPNLYQCAASINGVLDLPRLIADDQHYIGGSSWTRHIGLEDTKAKTVSPYHQAKLIGIPMLIVQAKDDSRVHLDQGKKMAKRLRRLKLPVEYVEVEFGGHSMTNEAARQQILRSLEAFLSENLGAGQAVEKYASQQTSN